MAYRQPEPGGLTKLRGRRAECAALDGMITAVREGHSRALVVRGEAGVGKTALLEYLLETASGFGCCGRWAWSLRWSCRSLCCINCARRCSVV